MTVKGVLSSTPWWGAPKKFTTQSPDRRISWLELFFDLVYVIAISAITQFLSRNFSFIGLSDYIYLFAIIFWGWLNGSLYHDLHGNEGLRTKLMTLWQMLIIAALVITLHPHTQRSLMSSTMVLLLMQAYITYLWFSVGFYDRDHRRLNRPYTFFYLLSFALIFSTLFLNPSLARSLFYLSLFFNYVPPFFSIYLFRRRGMQMSLSSSMTERLGLFTIIIFGEVVLNVTNGVISAGELKTSTWIEFALAMGIVFSLWWLFFTMISDKKCKPGLLCSSVFELLFIPTLVGLGLLAASFNHLFDLSAGPVKPVPARAIFGVAISLFMIGTRSMMSVLDYPEVFAPFRGRAANAFIVTAVAVVLFVFASDAISLVFFLAVVLVVLVSLIFYLNRIWFLMLKTQKDAA